MWPTLWNIDVFDQKLASNVILNFHHDLPVYPTNLSVDKMSFMSMFLIVFTISSINGQKLPDQKFVTDLVTNFNRFGIVLHLPIIKFSHIHDYYKSINQYKWVLNEKTPSTIKSFLPQRHKKKGCEHITYIIPFLVNSRPSHFSSKLFLTPLRMKIRPRKTSTYTY